MGKATTSCRNLAEHLRTSEDMAAYLETGVGTARQTVQGKTSSKLNVPAVLGYGVKTTWRFWYSVVLHSFSHARSIEILFRPRFVSSH
jgi:hypothetical protein